jgi:hypothetical protein
MSKLIYSEALEQKRKVQSKPLLTSHSGLMIIAVVIVAISLFIAFGFVYLGYSSGDYSTEYQLCKDGILADVRTGTYQSVNEIMAALKAC